MAVNESEVENELDIRTGKQKAADRGPSATPTAMLIRVFGKKDHEPYGDIVHYELKKPVPYHGAAELVLRIDAISRGLDLPDFGNTFRSVRRPGDEGTNVLPEEYWREKPMGEQNPPQEVQKASGIRDTGQETGGPSSGVLASGSTDTSPDHDGPMKSRDAPATRVRDTIYLQLIGRQHTSIQGRIWGRVTRKKYVSFRSALELIYLLSEAV